MHLDEQALQYHLERGDFSRWLDGTIADKELATPAAVWEDQLLARSRPRHQLGQAVGERYLHPHNHHGQSRPTHVPRRSRATPLRRYRMRASAWPIPGFLKRRGAPFRAASLPVVSGRRDGDDWGLALVAVNPR